MGMSPAVGAVLEVVPGVFEFRVDALILLRLGHAQNIVIDGETHHTCSVPNLRSIRLF